MRFSIKKSLYTIIALFLLVSDLLIYWGGKWYFSSGYLMTTPHAIIANIFLWLASIICVILYIYKFSYHLRYSQITNSLLAIIGLFSIVWCASSIFNGETAFTIIIRQYSPFMLFFMCFLVLGCDDENYYRMVRLARYVMMISLVLTLYTEFKFLFTYGFASRSKSSALHVYYWESVLTWLFYTFNTDNIKKDVGQKICTGALVVAAFLSLSRSNIIIVLLMCFLYFYYNDKEKKAKMGTYFRIIVTIGVSIFLFSQLAPESFLSIMDRLTNDTRSEQFEIFFSQIPWKDFFVGGGMGATYTFSRFENYSYLDNANMVMAFRYGVIPVVSILLIFVNSLIVAYKKKMSGAWQIVLVWLLVTNGLSVYLNYKITFGYFLLMLSVGHILKRDTIME